MRRCLVICEADWVPIRCLIVDDNDSFLEAARVLLEREGLNVVGVVSTCADALRQASLLGPDVVLVDISLGEESGLELARRLVDGGQVDGRTVILISTRAEEDVADLIAESPAAGFLPKAELSESAIRRIVDARPG
jgi:DNA-binding NarL/FixJ family response regulator